MVAHAESMINNHLTLCAELKDKGDSAKTNDHRCIVGASPTLAMKRLRTMTVQAFLDWRNGCTKFLLIILMEQQTVTNPAVISMVVCHNKTLNQQCILTQARPQ